MEPSLPGCAAIVFLILCLAAPRAAWGSPGTDVGGGVTATPTSALVGSNVTLNISITNLGLTTASNIVASDILPSAFQWTQWNSVGTPAAPFYNPTNGSLTISSIAPGVVDTLTISNIATNDGVYTNIVDITSPNSSSASVVVTVTPQNTDLALSEIVALYDGPVTNQFQPGQLAVFTVTVTNLGPGTAYDIDGSDVLPPGFTFVDWANNGSGYYPEYDSTNGTWELFELPPGDWGSYSIYATASSVGTYTNASAITSALDIDPNSNNNTTSAVATVLPTYADLSVTKSANESLVTLGDVVTFTIVASNGGPSSVQDAVVLEGLYPGWNFVGVSNGPNAIFFPADQAWTIYNLPPFATEVLALQAQAVATGYLTNVAQIVPPGGVTDPNQANNTAVLALLAAAPPPPQADLAVTITALTNNVYVTNPIPFNMTVSNIGPNNASNIMVKAILPNTLYIIDETNPLGASWDPPSRTLTLTNLAVGDTFTFQIQCLPLVGGTFTNAVQILTSQPTDPNTNNNYASTVITFFGYSACGIATLCNGSTVNSNAIVTLQPLSNILNTLTLTNNTGTTGAFCFTNLLPGVYQLTIAPANPNSGIATYQQNVTVDANTGQLLPVSTWLAITGVVTFGPGGPGYPNLNVNITAGGNTQTVMTDPNGVYLATGLAAQQYTVTPQPPAGLTSFPVSSNVTVGPGGACPPSANFVLRGALKIQGRLTTCAGLYIIAYGTVGLSTAQFPNLATYNVGSDGRYSFTNLPPGVYTLTPAHPTFTFAPATVNVTLATANVTQNLAGTANAGVAGGKCISANRGPLAGITINVQTIPRNVNAGTTTTAADGTFSFNLPAGNYVIIPTPPQAGFTFNPTVSAPFTIGGANPACNNYFVFAGSQNSVDIVALEAVQVCQDWQNNVPLVRNKRTLLRAFLTPHSPNTNTVRVNGAMLQVQSGTTSRTLSPRVYGVDARVNYGNPTYRNLASGSLAFDIPTTLATGNVTFTLKWPNGILGTLQNPQQTAVVNNATTVNFQSMPALPISWVLVNWKFGATTTPAPMSLITTQRTRLLAGMPTTSLAPDNSGGSLDWNPPSDPSTAAGDDIEKLRNHLQTQLKRLRVTDRTKTIYHGVLTGTAISGQAGGVPGNTSFADMSSPPSAASHKNLPIHEVSHNLARQHDVSSAFGFSYKYDLPLKNGLCMEVAMTNAPDYPMDMWQTTPLAPTLGPMQLGDFRYIYGFDASDRTYISPITGTADVMSYCEFTTPWVWPGIYSYTNMINYLLSRFGPPPPEPASGVVQYPCWIVSGELEESSNTLSLDPLFPVVLSQPPTLPNPGPYTLVLLDINSNILESVPFQPDIPVIEDDEATNILYVNFVFEVPQVTGVASVQILANSAPLTNRVVLPHSPTVQFTSPLPGAVISNGPLTLTWNASELGGSPLIYWLQYSSDGGADWNTLALDLTNTQFTIASQLLTGTSNGYFEVTASDGFNSASAETGPLTLPVNPPIVAIDLPLAGDVYTGSQPIILHASAIDQIDGDLADTQFSWMDNVNGSLGSGTNEVYLSASSLTPGPHLLTVTAIDSSGLESTTNVAFTVQQLQPIQLTAMIDTNDNTMIDLTWPDADSTLAVWAAFSLDNPEWFLVEGEPTDDSTNQILTLQQPILEDSLYYTLAPP
jgi:uncharacterized repeat protein (TIGR01451 family)